MLILSDIHGDMNAVSTWATLVDEKYCIQLGDFGMWFSETTNTDEEFCLNYIEEMCKATDKYLFSILGNHDCWPRYLKLETSSDWDFKTWKLRDHIYIIQPGEIVNLEGKTFLCIGGADSLDKEWRAEYEKTNGVKIWWTEEAITAADITNAKINLAKYGNKVDYILTHCEPATFIYKCNLFRTPYATESERKLDELLSFVDFKVWYGAHVHTSCEVETGGKKIVTLKIDEVKRI